MTMSPSVYFFHFILINWAQGQLKYQSYTDTWYETWINNGVASPFLIAYNTLNNKIINKLILINPNSDEETIKLLSNLLKCRFETVHTQLRRANDTAEQIRTSLEHDESVLLLQISSQEKFVRLKEEDLNKTKISLEQTEHQINRTESTMNDYRQSVNKAEEKVQSAQNAANKFYKCKQRQRTKQLSGECDSMNSSGLKNTHASLSLAMHSKHSAQHGLNVHQQTLRNQRFRQKFAKSQLQSATTQLHILQSKLNQTKTLFKHMSFLSQKFKAIEIYLREVLVSSTVFKDHLINLIDFENVIDPLNDIYKEMVNNKLINVKNADHLTETVQPITVKLEKVKETIKSWDMLDIDENDIRVSCLLIEDD